MRSLSLLVVVVASLLTAEATARDAQAPPEEPDVSARAILGARDRGLEWLTKHQSNDGSWGKNLYLCRHRLRLPVVLVGRGRALRREAPGCAKQGLGFLMVNQKDGVFPIQGHSWIHGQGFATLALSEAYGRSLFCKTKPDLDPKKVREAVARSVEAIAKNQSDSGGWWYTPGARGQHEGSTTVCAVQALVSASNFGIKIDEAVLGKGFDYLKKCQTAEGGFNYQLGDNTNMKEGTAAGVATLGLMKQFDTTVMVNGYKFLLKTTPAAISAERFPYYGHFYGIMGMQLLGQEFKEDKDFRENTSRYIAAARKDVAGWQQNDGSFPRRGYMREVKSENDAYSTAFGTLLLGLTEARLSIGNRTPPRLPNIGDAKPR